jgi:hypothetical protein
MEYRKTVRNLDRRDLEILKILQEDGKEGGGVWGFFSQTLEKPRRPEREQSWTTPLLAGALL